MENATMTALDQYLSFNLGDEKFAIPIDKVREVLTYTTPTRVPRMPEFIRGVINLRGEAVPVIDIKNRFGMGETEQTVATCIIIAEVRTTEGDILMGVMSDSVDEVFELSETQIEPPPRVGLHLNVKFLRGMGKKDDKFILVLSIDDVFTDTEIETVKAGTGTGDLAQSPDA